MTQIELTNCGRKRINLIDIFSTTLRPRSSSSLIVRTSMKADNFAWLHGRNLRTWFFFSITV